MLHTIAARHAVVDSPIAGLATTETLSTSWLTYRPDLDQARGFWGPPCPHLPTLD